MGPTLRSRSASTRETSRSHRRDRRGPDLRIDARVDPAASLGLHIGDAHVIRNAGGRATEDAIRSLLISSWLLGTREFAVIHHTDCGMTKFTDPVLRDMIRDQAGVEVDMDFLSFEDPEQSARDDVGSEGPKGSRTA